MALAYEERRGTKRDNVPWWLLCPITGSVFKRVSIEFYSPVLDRINIDPVVIPTGSLPPQPAQRPAAIPRCRRQCRRRRAGVIGPTSGTGDGGGGPADWHAPPGGNTHSNTSYRPAHSTALSSAHGPVHSSAHSQLSGSQQHS